MIRTAAVVTFACFILCPALVRADSGEDPAKLFADGKALLTKGDFDGALKALEAAAKADSKNDEYRQEASVLRRIIKIRKNLDDQKDMAKWEATARSLRAFYYDNDIYTEALALDKRVHARLNTPESAAMLAETQLELGRNAEAAELLGDVEDGKLTPQARVLLGIARAREKNVDGAREALAKLPKAEEAGAGLLFDMARLASLTGDQKRAAELLTKCFEATPPSRLASFKAYARQCKDLGGLAGTEAFTKALATESKVAESKCSGGSDCGKCPMKGGCEMEKGGKAGQGEKGACPNEKKGEKANKP